MYIELNLNPKKDLKNGEAYLMIELTN